jgi:hypothetical protein
MEKRGVVRLLLVVTVVLWTALGASSAYAQPCGDADGNGNVSVTDGVQALRAAAGLPSSCAAGRCDVDGNGSISVTDGVNVLRKVAGLAITEACPGGSTNASVRAFVGEMTKIARITGASSAQLRVTAAGSTPCDDGFIELDGQTSRFENCRFGNVVIDGAVTTTTILSDPENQRFIRSDVYEQYEVRFLDIDFTFRQDGTSTVDIDSKANRLVENANLTIFTAQSATGQDEYTLRKVDLTTDTQTGTVLTGELVTALASAGVAGIKAVTLGFVVGTVVDVDVEFDDGRFEAFTYDLESGELTPAGFASLRATVYRRNERRQPSRREIAA